jgi:phage tail sheath gpL-like
MKCITVILLFSAVLFGQIASFTTGQAARLVIGQETFTSQDTNSSDIIIGAPAGVAYCANTLLVADSNQVGALPSNNRVLVYSNLSSMLPAPTAQLKYNSKCPVCVGQANVVLGQPNFTSTVQPLTSTQNNLSSPAAVACDGVHVAVADTNNNRVLIWNHLPTVNDQPADVVVGQPNFTSFAPGIPASAKTLRGPQGVWIQNGKLYIADTQDNRVLIYNQIPTANNAAADLVLGQPNFTSAYTPSFNSVCCTTEGTVDLPIGASATSLFNPVSVTTDGTHLFVADLGYNRVLIWNSLPTVNQAPADVEIGQVDMTGVTPDNGYTIPADLSLGVANSDGIEFPILCTVSNGVDNNGNPTFPSVCNATLNFPRFAMAVGSSLVVADGGNDRVLIYNTIPTANAASADTIIGEIGGTVDQATDAVDSMSAPSQMAWDGTNLYVADIYNRRVTVYSLATTNLPYQAVRNAANLNVTAFATVTIGGTVASGNVVTITINNVAYNYTVKATDTLDDVVLGLVNSIQTSNSGTGDPNLMATADIATGTTDPEQVVLTALVPGVLGNQVAVSSTVTSGSTVTATASGANLSGGGDATNLAPGTVASVVAGPGTTLTDQTASANPSNGPLPTQLAGVQVYFNGIAAPIYMVSPTIINAQIPWEINDTTSINAYVRAVLGNGTIATTSPVAVTVVPANPGIYAQPGTNPSLGLVYHASSHATGLVSVDGSVNPGDIATITIRDRTYNYTVQAGDSLDSIRDNFIVLLNQDPEVTATAAGVFDRIILTALVAGPAGDNIPIGALASAGADVVMTAFTTSTCCAAVAGSLVTNNSPAVPNEFIYVIATGLGLPVLTDTNSPFIVTGVPYPAGGPVNQPQESVNAIASGSTADVLTATLMPGSVGQYIVLLHLNGSIATNQTTALTIAQDTYVSNIVYFPVVSQ